MFPGTPEKQPKGAQWSLPEHIPRMKVCVDTDKMAQYVCAIREPSPACLGGVFPPPRPVWLCLEWAQALAAYGGGPALPLAEARSYVFVEAGPRGFTPALGERFLLRYLTWCRFLSKMCCWQHTADVNSAVLSQGGRWPLFEESVINI